MKKKGSRPTDGGGNWMDTYGDMVTLLLTFFIMLYAISAVDQGKWEIFVKSMLPESGDVKEAAINEQIGNGDHDVTGTLKVDREPPSGVDMDKLYLTLAQKMNDIGIDGVTISRGKDYTFIVFQDKTFFEGDSSVLTEQGKETLDVFCNTIAPAKEEISQISIMGHTSQGDPGKPNNPRTDRMLSAMRAAEVCIFIQAKNVIEPEKLVSISYGQFRPVDTSETREGRARNRRVELLMVDKGADIRDLNEYYDAIRSGAGAEDVIVTHGNQESSTAGFETVEPGPEQEVSVIPSATVEEMLPQ